MEQFGAIVFWICLSIAVIAILNNYVKPLIDNYQLSNDSEGRKIDKRLREMTSIHMQMQMQNKDLDPADPDFFDDIGELDPEILEEIFSLLDQGEDEKAARLFMIKLAEKRSEETDSF